MASYYPTSDILFVAILNRLLSIRDYVKLTSSFYLIVPLLVKLAGYFQYTSRFLLPLIRPLVCSRSKRLSLSRQSRTQYYSFLTLPRLLTQSVATLYSVVPLSLSVQTSFQSLLSDVAVSRSSTYVQVLFFLITFELAFLVNSEYRIIVFLPDLRFLSPSVKSTLFLTSYYLRTQSTRFSSRSLKLLLLSKSSSESFSLESLLLSSLVYYKAYAFCFISYLVLRILST